MGGAGLWLQEAVEPTQAAAAPGAPPPPPISISLVAKLRGRRVSFLLYVCDALQKERWQSVSVGWSVSKVRSVCAAGLGGHSISMHQDGNSR